MTRTSSRARPRHRRVGAAAAYWATLAEGVPPGPSSAATAARRSLFARLDVDADGFVTLGELERELPGALGAAVPSTKLEAAARPPSRPS